VSNYLRRASEAGLEWPLASDIDDEALEKLLLPAREENREQQRGLPPMSWVHQELQRTKGMTLLLLWEEYRKDHPEGYGYTQFCERYRQFRAKLDPVLRQVYQPGEKMFVDWAGETMWIEDGENGQRRKAYVFVACLGASNYTFARAYANTQRPNWIQAHIDAWEFFGGVARLTIPDNEKTGVNRACRYEPELNQTYEDLARHYGTIVLPTRSGKPRDKAKVEKAVQDIEQRIIAPLRNQTFFSLGEMNQSIRRHLAELNRRPFQKMEGCRYSHFVKQERPMLGPLPKYPYELAAWGKAKANIDYHVQIDNHLYSVPYQLVQHLLEYRQSDRTVEIFHNGVRIAVHNRSLVRGERTTDRAHMPKAHQRHSQWTPSRIMSWAENEVGPNCAQVVERILQEKPHPEQGYRSCLGLIRLGRVYEKERVEAACLRALKQGVCAYKSVQSILKNKLDKQPLPQQTQEIDPLIHGNLRGSGYYK
jgi:transposase